MQLLANLEADRITQNIQFVASLVVLCVFMKILRKILFVVNFLAHISSFISRELKNNHSQNFCYKPTENA